ncbi:hypothetical protein N7490_011566 [Penicillium lividum]|nr:hypothetical protein N7490_011566 [Penicillium lividum]
MPLWQIYHPPGTFEDNVSKQALATDITKIYTGVGLPAFYVVVQFIQLQDSDVWVGGTSGTEKPFIRVVITQIAVRLPDDDVAYRRNTMRIDNALKPHIQDKGYNWEYHVDETERRLWKINGMIPPPLKSEEEKMWVRENRPVPYDGAYA